AEFALFADLSLSARVPLIYGSRKDQRPHNSDCARNEEWRFGSDLPQQPANCGGRGDAQTLNKIIESNSTRAEVRFGEVDDHRLAGRLADLSQTSNDECRYQQGKL